MSDQNSGIYNWTCSNCGKEHRVVPKHYGCTSYEPPQDRDDVALVSEKDGQKKKIPIGPDEYRAIMTYLEEVHEKKLYPSEGIVVAEHYILVETERHEVEEFWASTETLPLSDKEFDHFWVNILKKEE